MAWTVKIDLIEDWLNQQDRSIIANIGSAISKLEEEGPNLGRPLVDVLHSSKIHNLKELRPYVGPGVEIRVLFVFDPLRNAVLLLAGDKAAGKNNARRWNKWYKRAIPQAESVYRRYLEREGL